MHIYVHIGCPLVLSMNFLSGVFSGMQEVIRREGFFALYKGNGAQMIRIFPYAATQFTAFEMYKKV